MLDHPVSSKVAAMAFNDIESNAGVGNNLQVGSTVIPDYDTDASEAARTSKYQGSAVVCSRQAPDVTLSNENPVEGQTEATNRARLQLERLTLMGPRPTASVRRSLVDPAPARPLAPVHLGVVDVPNQIQRQRAVSPPAVVVSSEDETRPTASRSDMPPRAKFLLFIKILFKCLDQANEVEVRNRAKKIVAECTRRNRKGEPEFTPLMEAIDKRLRPFIGEAQWRRATLLCRHFLSKEQNAKV